MFKFNLDKHRKNLVVAIWTIVAALAFFTFPFYDDWWYELSWHFKSKDATYTFVVAETAFEPLPVPALEFIEYHYAYLESYDAHKHDYNWLYVNYNWDCGLHHGEDAKVRPPFVPAWIIEHPILYYIVPNWHRFC